MIRNFIAAICGAYCFVTNPAVIVFALIAWMLVNIFAIVITEDYRKKGGAE